MKFSMTISSLAFLSTFASVNATCTLKTSLDDTGKTESRKTLCTPQAKGNFQVALDVTESSVPTFNGGNPLGGISGNKAFLLYDYKCALLVAYSPDESGNNCGIPYELGGLNSPIKITSVNFDVGAPRFEFDFNGMHYNVKHSECGGCGDLSQGLTAEQGCKCGFFAGDQCVPGTNICIGTRDVNGTYFRA